MSRISGPLLDRIDLHLEVPALPSTDLLNNVQTEGSLNIKKRIVKTRSRQNERFAHTTITANSYMNHRQGKRLLKAAIEELGLSARAYDKILKVARTVSDLAGCENILPEHIAEAIQYRSLDRNFWS